MTISVISSEKKTTTGNITIPVNCDYVVALVSGATNPTINLVAMTQNVSISNGDEWDPTIVSISTMSSPPTGTWGCVIGQETRFVYLSGGGAVRDADGSTTGAAVTLTSSATDLILGIQNSGTSMTVDGSNATFLDNYYRGYLAAPDTSVVCDGDGVINAFISIIDSGAVETGDGTMICWIN